MSICKLCGSEIKFEVNENGRYEPFDLDGVSHFRTCPELRRRRELYANKPIKTPKEITQEKLGKEQTFLEDF